MRLLCITNVAITRLTVHIANARVAAIAKLLGRQLTLKSRSNTKSRCSNNWLVHRIHDAALTAAINKYANGVLLDIGCGEKPYRTLTEGHVAAHLGLDHPGSLHSKQQVDIFGTAYETGVADDSVDTVLCTVVMEHLERPQDALDEMYRILKPGGHVILSAPLFWHLHEEPRDSIVIPNMDWRTCLPLQDLRL